MKFLQFNFKNFRCNAIDVTQRWWLGTEMWYRVTNPSDVDHSSRPIFFSVRTTFYEIPANTFRVRFA